MKETHLPTKRLPDDDTSLNLPSSTQLLVHDGDDCIFERNAPHWDGRWAGHIHLPLEVVENNDHDDCIDDDDDDDDDDDGSDNSDDDDVSSEDEGIAPQSSSSLFLTTASKLIYHWTMLLEDDDDDKCNDDATSSSSNGGRKNNNNSDSTKTIVVIPHIVMHPLQQTIRKSCSTTLLNNHISSCQCNDSKSITTDMTTTTTATTATTTTTNNNNLHISLTRPIYLPGPSVSSFMDSIVRDMTLFISIAKRGSCSSSSSASSSATNVGRQQTTSTGRTIYLQPRNAIILTNDNHTRSFLCIPISTDSSRWIKHTFLPPIDAIMSRFGLATYYNNNTDDSKDGGCILHVSIASVKGDIIPLMLQQKQYHNKRSKCEGSGEAAATSATTNESNTRRIMLYTNEERDSMQQESSIPHHIPMKVTCVKCEFGKDKQCTIPL